MIAVGKKVYVRKDLSIKGVVQEIYDGRVYFTTSRGAEEDYPLEALATDDELYAKEAQAKQAKLTDGIVQYPRFEAFWGMAEVERFKKAVENTHYRLNAAFNGNREVVKFEECSIRQKVEFIGAGFNLTYEQMERYMEGAKDELETTFLMHVAASPVALMAACL